MVVCYDIVEGSVVSIRQLNHHRIRRERVIKLADLSLVHEPKRENITKGLYISSDEL
jgi:hypothetical protein